MLSAGALSDRLLVQGASPAGERQKNLSPPIAQITGSVYIYKEALIDWGSTPNPAGGNDSPLPPVR
jgi:hypothetical protein